MKPFLLFMIIVLMSSTALAFDTSDPSTLGHGSVQVDWTKEVPQDMRIAGSNTGWNGWNYALYLRQSNHVMITFPAGNLGFGMHQNGRFYWSRLNDRHLMTLSKTGQLIVKGNLEVGKSIFSSGSAVCLSGRTNCPSNCGPYANGKEWTVSRKCGSGITRSITLTCMQGYVVPVSASSRC